MGCIRYLFEYIKLPASGVIDVSRSEESNRYGGLL
jgi:hypothetical protein